MDRVTLQHYVDRANKGLEITQAIEELKSSLKNVQFSDVVRFQDIYGNAQAVILKKRVNGKVEGTYPLVVDGIVEATKNAIEKEIARLEQELAEL